MKAVIEPISSVSKKISITFEDTLYAKSEQEVLKKIQSNAMVPGFRKGKVPFDVLRKRYGELLDDEIKQSLLDQSVDYLAKQENLEIASLLNTEFVKPAEGGMCLTMEVEIVPTIDLPDYKSITLDKEDIHVEEAEIQDLIERLQKQQASYELVDREAKAQDYVQVSYEGYCGDKPVDDFEDVPALWRKQKSTWEEAANKVAPGIPELVDALVGMRAGNRKDVEVKFPDDFPVAELKKKAGRYVVEVKEVREVKLPALDEAFFKQYQVKDLEELKQFASKTLMDRKYQVYASQQKQRISEFLIKSVTCELPQAWVKRETEKVLQEMVDVFSSHGITDEKLTQEKEMVVQKAQSIADERIRLNLCFEKIAKQENLHLEGKDIEPVLIQEAMRRQIPAQKMLQMAQRDLKLRQDIQQKSMQAKMINWLFNQLAHKAEDKKD